MGPYTGMQDKEVHVYKLRFKNSVWVWSAKYAYAFICHFQTRHIIGLKELYLVVTV